MRRSPALRTQLAMLAVLALLVGAGVLAGHLHHQSAPRSTVTTPTSRVMLTGQVRAAAPEPCTSGPHGVRTGAPISVLDPNGSVVATSSLGTGAQEAGLCAWPFAVPVPAEASWSVQIADLPPQVVTAKALAAAGGRLEVADTP